MEKSFAKYTIDGSYHYDRALNPKSLRIYDPRLAARYHNSVDLLKPKTDSKILDAGSGEGVASILCCRKGAIVTAVELEPKAIELGKKIQYREKIPEDRLRFVQSDLATLPFNQDLFDGALSLEVIEHIKDTQKYLSEIKRVLKSGARLVISTPLRRSDGKLQDPYHVREYDALTLTDALSKNFSNTQIFAAWNPMFDNMYESNKPTILIAKIKRGIIKLSTRFGWSPFHWVSRDVHRCKTLIAVCTK